MQSNRAAGYLNSEAFSSALGDLDGSELAALDLVQDGLAGDAERLGCGIERYVAVGDVGDEAGADLVGQADPPGCVRCGLLAGQQAGFEPAVDRAVGDAELDGGLLDREEVAGGIGRRRGGDLVALAHVLDARFGEQQPGAGPAALLVKDRRDLPVWVMGRERPDELHGAFGSACALRPATHERDLQVGARTALPGDLDLCAARVFADGDDDFADQRAQQLFAVARGCRRCVPQTR